MAGTMIKQVIAAGQAILGIELGSTRIKAVLITPDHILAAQGSHTWENRLTDGIWTYSLKDIWIGLQAAYADLARDVEEKYGEKLKILAAIGISAMMHGYLVFDENDELLVPFRTWRNTMTEEAADALTDLFQFNIPQRWSVAHLYQAILNGEDHVSRICYQTTLAGYVHWKLTGQKVLGAADALVEEYYSQYEILPEGRDEKEFRRHVAEQAAMEIGFEKFLTERNYHAIVTHFGDLGSLRQLPGLAIQRLNTTIRRLKNELRWNSLYY